MNSNVLSRATHGRPWLLAILCVLALCVPAWAMAQAPGLSAADRADIQAFTINSDVFQRLKTVKAKAATMQIKRSRLNTGKVHSLNDMAKQMVTNDPRIKPLLAKYGFTPRQYLVASMSIIGTVVMMKRYAGTPQEAAVESQLNPANVQFYKQHKAAMDQLMHPAASASH